MTDAEMDCVEKMVTRYIEKTVYGVRTDYFRKLIKTYKIEISLDAISEEGLIMPHSEGVCADCCLGCPNTKSCVAISELTERQYFVITKIYQERLTEAEVGRALGISQQAVNFHKNKALTKLHGLLSVSNEG